MHENDEIARLKRELGAERKFSTYTKLIYGELTTHMLLETIAEGVLVVAADSTIVMVNRQVESMFGYSADELQGMDLDQLLLQQDRAAHHRHMHHFFNHPLSRPMGHGVEIQGRRKDGSSIYLEIGLSTLELSGKKFGLAVISDISQRKEMERLLHESNRNLDEFAQVVAHDLNDYVASLVSVGGLLKLSDQLEPGRQVELVESILSIGQKMSSIIRELLLLARMERVEVELGPVQMGPVVEAALMRLSERIEATSAHVEVGDLGPEVVGHGPWIEEVWYNFLSNAIAYGGPSPRIEIGCTDHGDSMEFWVRDHGIGMTPETASMVFERESDLRRGIIKGHGLGLSIVKNITERLHGSVGVKSEPGAGSTFSFCLKVPNKTP